MAEQPVLGFAGVRPAAAAGRGQADAGGAGGVGGPSPRSVSDLERGINRTARKDTALLLAGALGLAEPLVASFGGSPGRAPVAEVLAAMRAAAAGAAAGRLAPGGALAWSQRPYPGLVLFEERDAAGFLGAASWWPSRRSG